MRKSGGMRYEKVREYQFFNFFDCISVSKHALQTAVPIEKTGSGTGLTTMLNVFHFLHRLESVTPNL